MRELIDKYSDNVLIINSYFLSLIYEVTFLEPTNKDIINLISNENQTLVPSLKQYLGFGYFSGCVPFEKLMSVEVLSHPRRGSPKHVT